MKYRRRNGEADVMVYKLHNILECINFLGNGTSTIENNILITPSGWKVLVGDYMVKYSWVGVTHVRIMRPDIFKQTYEPIEHAGLRPMDTYVKKHKERILLGVYDTTKNEYTTIIGLWDEYFSPKCDNMFFGEHMYGTVKPLGWAPLPKVDKD